MTAPASPGLQYAFAPLTRADAAYRVEARGLVRAGTGAAGHDAASVDARELVN